MNEVTPEQINELTRKRQQGDCVLGDCTFLFGFASYLPLKNGIERVTEEKIDYVQEPVMGFVVLTQTCDIVKDCRKRPYIEVAALQVERDDYHLIKKFKMPSYVAIPALASKHVVANLDKTMTLEKPVLAIWNKFKIVRGLRDSDEIVNFAQALGRKRSRFAFPNEFVEVFKPFLDRIKVKHGKNTDEGQMLNEFKEMRVRSVPDWSSQNRTISFLFFVDKTKSAFSDWSEQIEAWKNLVHPEGTPFSEIEMLVVGYDELTAQAYKESIMLDLDGLSLSND